MTKPSQRTRGRRHVAVTLPSGRRTYHFPPRPHGAATCSKCGRELHGVVSGKSVAGSLRAPTRPYGGVLCHNCLASEIRQLARSGPVK